MKIRKWTDQQLIEAVPLSRSRRQVLMQLKLEPKGGNYATVKRHIERLKIDTSHFLGPGWNKGGVSPTLWMRVPTSEYLVMDSDYQSHKLKKRLFQEGLKKPICELCGWKEQSKDGRIPVELDHINGNHKDNRIENLRILCPNCHSLQPTHRGRNKKHY